MVDVEESSPELGGASSAIDLATNVVRGELRFTNSPTGDAFTLYSSLLPTPRPYQSCFVAGSSPAGSSSAFDSVPALSPCSYELSVPVAAAGSHYTFNPVYMTMNFELVNPEPAPAPADSRFVPATGPVTADFELCFAAAQVNVRRTCSAGSPGNVHLNLPGIAVPQSQTASTYVIPVAAGWSYPFGLYYYVQSGSRTVSRSVQFNSGSETFACDEVKTFDVDIDECLPPLPSGVLQGPYDVVGEDETFGMKLFASNAIDHTYGSYSDSVAPFTASVEDPTSYWRVSSLASAPHALSLTGAVRQGVDHAWFSVYVGNVDAIDGQIVTPARLDGDTIKYPFVMTPGYLHGDIALYVPWVAEPESYVFPSFTASADTDGRLYGTMLAYFGGSSRVEMAFAGAFEPSAKRFRAVYEVPLVTPYDQTTTWSHQIDLQMERAEVHGLVRGRMTVLAQPLPGSSAGIAVAAGTRVPLNNELCMGEAEFTFESQNGELFFSPNVSISGSLTNADNGLGRKASYFGFGQFVGTPEQPAQASDVGRVRIFAPKGTYSLNPQAYLPRPNDGWQAISLPSVQFDLPCGSSRLGAVQVSATGARCATVDGAQLLVRAKKNQGSAPIDRIWYTVNGGDEVDVPCAPSGCTTDQTLSVVLPLSELLACGNSVQFYASSSDALSVASYSLELENSADCVGSTCPAIHVDTDGDGVVDNLDNCPATPNADQLDSDADGQGDACDGDDDNDGVSDGADNCPVIANATQADQDGDSLGDACDPDVDGDGAANGADACVGTAPGSYTNPSGCSLLDLCPCANFSNHGLFMQCVKAVQDTFADPKLVHGEGSKLCK